MKMLRAFLAAAFVLCSTGAFAQVQPGTSPLSPAKGGTGINHLGTGVSTALGVNTGSPGSFLVNGGAVALGATTITSNSSQALAVGANGVTNPVFQVDASAGSVATGWKMTGNPAGGTSSLIVISSGANEGGQINAKGSGLVQIANSSTGGVSLAGGGGGVSIAGATIGANALAITGNTALSGFINLNSGGPTNPGEIWSTNAINGLLSWRLTNSSNGTSGNTTMTVGNDVGTADFSIWSSTFSNALFTNRAGIVVGSNNAGMLLTTVGAGHSIDLAVNNTKIASILATGIQTFVAGTAANPSVVINTAGYGFYQPGTNQFGFALAGSNLWDYGITNANKFFFGGPIVGGSSILSQFATGGVGYATGAGGAVTQTTSRSTGVTLSKVTGAITLVSAAGSATPTTFTLTNTAIAANDVVKVTQQSGTDKYEIFVSNTAAGSCQITFFTTGGTTTEQPVFNFVVIKGVNSFLMNRDLDPASNDNDPAFVTEKAA